MELIKIPRQKEKNIYNEKLRVAAYVRVSTKFDDQINSYESQCNYFRSKIEQNSNWEFAGIFGDKGISGRRVKNRTAFRQMISEAKLGNIDLILTKSVSRFARNTVDTLKFVRELKAIGVGVIFEEERINTRKMEGELLLAVFSGIAETEIEGIRRRTTQSWSMKFADKDYKETHLLYGYRVDSDTKELVLEDEEADIVKTIYKLYINGKSTKEIALFLNDLGIKAPRGDKWTPSGLRYILTNIRYTGDFQTRRFNPGESVTLYNNNVPIIDKGTFNKVVEVRKSRRRREYDKEFKQENYTGYIRCNYCCKTYRVDHLKSGGLAWHCINSKKCVGVRIPNETIDDAFIKLIKRIIKGKQKETNKLLISKNNKLIKLYKNKLYVLSDNYLNKKISLLDFDKEKDKLNKKISELDNLNNNYFLEQKNDDKNRKVLNSLRQIVKGYNIDNFNKELFDKIIKFVIIGRNKRDLYVIRFIGMDNIYEEDSIDKKFVCNSRYRIVTEFSIKSEIKYKYKNTYKKVNRVKVTYEIVEA